MMSDHICVLGGGESGTGAALLAKAKGYKVLLSDLGEISEQNSRKLRDAGVALEEGSHEKAIDFPASEAIISPGIPLNTAVVHELRSKGVNIISEIEFSSRYSNSFIIAVTGSNGKTTTTGMIGHLLKEAGKDVLIAGNIGNSWAASLIDGDHDYTVLELSSFQLDSCYDFHANIALITSISPDHLDRYNYDLQKYIDSKFRITLNQTQEDAFVYNQHSELLKEAFAGHSINARPFALNHQSVKKLTQDVFTACRFRGKHNEWNARAAAIAGILSGVDIVTILSALKTYTPPPHRMEWVAKVEGVTYINDSKATNVDSTYYALQGVGGPCVWIAGGQDKGNDYSQLFPVIDNVKALICLGVDNTKLIEAFEGKIESIHDCNALGLAMLTAGSIATDGDTVLLSPACASFDLFENYIDRGDQFKELVKRRIVLN